MIHRHQEIKFVPVLPIIPTVPVLPNRHIYCCQHYSKGYCASCQISYCRDCGVEFGIRLLITWYNTQPTYGGTTITCSGHY